MSDIGPVEQCNPPWHTVACYLGDMICDEPSWPPWQPLLEDIKLFASAHVNGDMIAAGSAWERINHALARAHAAADAALRQELTLLKQGAWKAHRPVSGIEANNEEGKFHGFCIRCITPWPCEYSPESQRALDDAARDAALRQAGEALRGVSEEAYRVVGGGKTCSDHHIPAGRLISVRAALAAIAALDPTYAVGAAGTPEGWTEVKS